MLIDTLVLGLERAEYRDANVEIEPPKVNMRTGEISPFIDVQGMRARKAYVNLDNLYFTSSAKRIPSGSTIQVDKLQFSIPKLLGLDGVYVSHLSHDDICDALGVARDVLKDNGIFTDTFDARLWRLDVACDVSTTYPFSGYGVLFDAMHYRNYADANLGSTYRTGGKGAQWCVYDKRAECVARGVDVAGLPEYLMRFEYRMLRRYAVTSAGFSDVTSLIDGYDNLPAIVSDAWGKVLFDAGEDIYTYGGSWLRTLQDASDRGSVRWLDKALKQLGLYLLKEKGVSPDNLKRVILGLGGSDASALNYSDALRDAGLDGEGGSLLAELKGKVQAQLIQ
jgi:hypothetical protein